MTADQIVSVISLPAVFAHERDRADVMLTHYRFQLARTLVKFNTQHELAVLKILLDNVGNFGAITASLGHPASLLHHVLSVRGDAAGGTDVINSLTRHPSADVLVSRGTCFSAGHTESRNLIEFPLWPYELHDRSKCESHLMSRTAHHYLIFETADGFCGIAWNSMGITRFQLRQEAPKRPNEFCCDAYPAPNPARLPRRWPRRSPL